ncbi:hypothetical protein GGX14DRAFT_553804 [Mycena pura]|uniref:Uncharacterized protein n=1 Tax=Mycena pura TaxID=153505 RepID=A0AAD6YUZ2_9AGAR|nr:hypothetical protein GGX14DRAFT_553804 [Mycena pura]
MGSLVSASPLSGTTREDSARTLGPMDVCEPCSQHIRIGATFRLSPIVGRHFSLGVPHIHHTPAASSLHLHHCAVLLPPPPVSPVVRTAPEPTAAHVLTNICVLALRGTPCTGGLQETALAGTWRRKRKRIGCAMHVDMAGNDDEEPGATRWRDHSTARSLLRRVLVPKKDVEEHIYMTEKLGLPPLFIGERCCRRYCKRQRSL